MTHKPIPICQELIQRLTAELCRGTDALRTIREINDQMDELGVDTPQFDALALAGMRAATRSAHCLEACEAMHEELKKALAAE